MDFTDRLKQSPESFGVASVEGHGHEDAIALPLQLRGGNESPGISGKIQTAALAHRSASGEGQHLRCGYITLRTQERVTPKRATKQRTTLRGACALACGGSTRLWRLLLAKRLQQ